MDAIIEGTGEAITVILASVGYIIEALHLFAPALHEIWALTVTVGHGLGISGASPIFAEFAYFTVQGNLLSLRRYRYGDADKHQAYYCYAEIYHRSMSL